MQPYIFKILYMISALILLSLIIRNNILSYIRYIIDSLFAIDTLRANNYSIKTILGFKSG